MALLIEDGSGVENAASYATVSEARLYASARGITLSVVDADVEVLLTKALDYVESFRDRFKGDKLNGTGYLQWPRLNVDLDGFAVESDEIPLELVNAQIQAAIEYLTVDPLGTVSTAAVRREKVGPLEVEYAVASGDLAFVNMPKVDALLTPLLSVGGGFLTGIRV